MRAFILAAVLASTSALADEPTEPCLDEAATAYRRLYELRASENSHAKATQGAPADVKEAARGEVKKAAQALIDASDAYKACLDTVPIGQMRPETTEDSLHEVPVRPEPKPAKEPTP